MTIFFISLSDTNELSQQGGDMPFFMLIPVAVGMNNVGMLLIAGFIGWFGAV